MAECHAREGEEDDKDTGEDELQTAYEGRGIFRLPVAVWLLQ